MSTIVARSEHGRDYDAALGIWSGRPDPDGKVSVWLTSDGFLNRMGYVNPAVAAAFTAARRTTDPTARRLSYHAVAERWLADRC